MLTVRVHLDDVIDENGPLRVLLGSHRSGKVMQTEDAAPISVLVKRGDVLLMRPLLAHGSRASHPDTERHRRILHLEFASSPEIPDDYSWHDFIVPPAAPEPAP
jgi:ectoine hydroxylase-related dioxygenase (phytanoyl-CoA dioxygenase family)